MDSVYRVSLEERIDKHIGCPLCRGTKQNMNGMACQYWGNAKKTEDPDAWLIGHEIKTVSKRNV